MEAKLGAINGIANREDGSVPLFAPQGREFLGGDLLAQCLHALGVRIAFGLHGGHLDAFLMGCHEAGIKLIDTRHETVAVQAAEGYSKISNKVGVAFVTANSGFSNGLPGLASAMADRSPVFCITSSPPLRDAETNTLQGFHQQDIIAKPLTKFAHRVTNAEEIPRLVAHAWRTAISGAPGPVLIDFPIDVLFTPPDLSRISWGAIARPALSKPAPDPTSIELTMGYLQKAERPCVITGTGMKIDASRSQLNRFATATNIPIFNTAKFGGLLPAPHPCRAGPAASLALLPSLDKPPPDLIILLGARTGFLLGSRSGAILPKNGCKYIQVDTDGSEIGRTHAIDLGVVSDGGLFLSAVNFELSKYDEDAMAKVKASDEWFATATSLRHQPGPHDDDANEMPDGRLHPGQALKKVFDSLPPGAITIIDGGEASCWAQDLVEMHSNSSTYITATGYLGFLGSGWGYSLGAAIADPTRLVVNLQGDGSAGFHIAELETFARHGCRVLTVVMNNAAWGMSKSGQELIFGEATDARPVSGLSTKTKYEMVAEGFGCVGMRVEDFGKIQDTVARLAYERGPSLLNMVVSERPIHPATRAMVGKPEKGQEEKVIVVPYYDNLPRPKYDDDEGDGEEGATAGA